MRQLLMFSFFIFLTQPIVAQIDDESRNALPPGPARISGYVLQNGAPVLNAMVRLEYEQGDTSLTRDFKTYGHGEYSVYMNWNIKNPTIVVLVDGNEKLRYSPEYWYEGSVHRKNLVIP